MASTLFVDFSPNTPIVAAWLNDVNNFVYNRVTDTGAVNAVLLTLPQQLSSIPDGFLVRWKATYSNTGATTLQIQGYGSYALQGDVGALQGGEIVAGGDYEATFSSFSNAWKLVTQTAGATQIAPATQTEHAVQQGQVTSQVASALSGQLASIETAIQQALYTESVAGGTSDAITASFTPAITATTLATGAVEVTIKAAFANLTTTPTFTPNPGVVTPATIVKGPNQPLVIGDIAGAAHWVTLQWDTTLSKWVLLNPAYGVVAQTGRLISVQVFTSSGTYTPTPGVTSYEVEAQGPGGSPGGNAATSSSQVACSAGGGSGAYAKVRYNSVPTSQTVTIGAPGAASSAGGAGNVGGTTSFGGLVSVPGGPATVAGSAVANTLTTLISATGSGAAPTITGGIVLAKVSSSLGGPAFALDGLAVGGAGASSSMGAGGVSSQGLPNGAIGSGYGSGAGGCSSSPSTVATSSYPGAGSIVIVREYT